MTQGNALARIVVLDTETTGLDPTLGHKIIEIGCVELLGRKASGKNFHYYLDPERDIDERAQAIHGISREDLEGKPRFTEVAEEMIAFLTGAEIVIHNAAFDVSFLDAELAAIQRPPVASFATVTDSLMLARSQFPGKKNTLDALCERLGVDNSNRTVHGALLDAQLLAEVYLALTRGQESLGIDVESAHSSRLAATKTLSPIRVLSADATEIAAHESVLASIAKKAKVVWDSA